MIIKSEPVGPVIVIVTLADGLKSSTTEYFEPVVLPSLGVMVVGDTETPASSSSITVTVTVPSFAFE